MSIWYMTGKAYSIDDAARYAGAPVRVSSAGKTFSMTGWKVGYSVGARDLITAAAKAHQFLTFTTAPNLQKAVAGLAKENSYSENWARICKPRRSTARGLAEIGFDV